MTNLGYPAAAVATEAYREARLAKELSVLALQKNCIARQRERRHLTILSQIILIAFSVWSMSVVAAAAHESVAVDQLPAAAGSESKSESAIDSVSDRLDALETRVRRLEAARAAEDLVRIEARQKLESGYWGRLDGN